MRRFSTLWGRWTILSRSVIIAFGVAVLLFAIGGLISPGFVVLGNISRVLVLASFLGIAAGGETLVILTGGIDLSIPALMTAGAILAANLSTHDAYPLWTALVISLGIMGIFGLMNGIGVVFIGIPPMVMTLGMNTLLLGAALIYQYGQPFGSASSTVSRLARGGWGPVPFDLLIWLVLSALLITIMGRTVFGKRIYAIGSDVLTSYYSGISISRVILAVYMLSGILAAIAGILLSGYTGYADLNMATTYQLETIAAVVVGGASILGGKGHYLGTIAGAVILTVLTSILLVINISEGVRDIIYGSIILGALFLYGRGRLPS